MTWNEILEHLRAAFAVIDEEEGKAVLGWRVGAAFYTQVVESASAFGESWLRLTSIVGQRADFCAERALEHNLTLAIGSLAFAGDSLVLAHLLPLAGLGRPQLDRALMLLAHEAARLGGHATPRRPLVQLADHFAD